MSDLMISRVVTIVDASLAANSVPQSSSRGSETVFTGATRVFDQSRVTLTCPMSSVILEYTTAAYAFSDASEKKCSCRLAIVFFITHRGIFS